MARASFASACSMSMIWSSRERNRSCSPIRIARKPPPRAPKAAKPNTWPSPISQADQRRGSSTQPTHSRHRLLSAWTETGGSLVHHQGRFRPGPPQRLECGRPECRQGQCVCCRSNLGVPRVRRGGRTILYLRPSLQSRAQPVPTRVRRNLPLNQCLAGASLACFPSLFRAGDKLLVFLLGLDL